MNRLLFLLVFILISNLSISQEVFSKYKSNYIDQEFEILISEKESEFLWIDMLSLDRISKSGGIFMSKNKYLEFIETLNEAKEKYTEWTQTAIENNVKELSKTMKYTTNVGGYFKYGGDFHFQFSVDLRYDYILINELYLLTLNTGKLKSSSNKFITNDGFTIVFRNTEEIDEFLDIISKEKIDEFLNKPNVEDLFKD